MIKMRDLLSESNVYDVKRITDSEYSFHTASGKLYKIYLYEIYLNQEVKFVRGNFGFINAKNTPEFKKMTNENDSFKILRTVFETIKKYVLKNDLDGITWDSTSKQKDSIYQQTLIKLFPNGRIERSKTGNILFWIKGK